MIVYQFPLSPLLTKMLAATTWIFFHGVLQTFSILLLHCLYLYRSQIGRSTAWSAHEPNSKSLAQNPRKFVNSKNLHSKMRELS